MPKRQSAGALVVCTTTPSFTPSFDFACSFSPLVLYLYDHFAGNLDSDAARPLRGL